MDTHFVAIVIALVMGVIARTYMMKIDYRQYPTYPQAYLSHFTLGVIAAGLGAVAIPAFSEKEYVAITFLAIAAQHFRDVRGMERQSLDNIEPTELVPKGTAYIEDIAKTFEARNYMAIITAVFTSATVYIGEYFDLPILVSSILAIIVGSIIIVMLNRMLKPGSIEEIAEVKSAEISFEGPILTIAGVGVMNIGLKESQKVFMENGVAVEIIPKDPNAVAILSNIGQRQAIQHNAAIQLGIRKDVDEPDFTPIARRNPDNGNIVMAIVTRQPDVNCLIEAVKKTPVLESSKREPLDSEVGKKLSS
ncbi:MAG: YIEGIA family protein [Clostridiaceae bacterium]|nr:YIEGIA family protein [Clostridiaceae bacterium]